jgi:hypothetical protein
VCLYGHGIVRGIFEEIGTEGLRGFEIWLPMMKDDDIEEAHRVSETFRDLRVSHAWDPDRIAGDLVARALDLTSTAWDIYLLYGRGIRWDREDLPQPSFWMAQLPSQSGIALEHFLDPGRFPREAHRLMEKDETRSELDQKLHFHARGILELMKKAE